VVPILAMLGIALGPGKGAHWTRQNSIAFRVDLAGHSLGVPGANAAGSRSRLTKLARGTGRELSPGAAGLSPGSPMTTRRHNGA
jgi:hypothetical protein